MGAALKTNKAKKQNKTNQQQQKKPRDEIIQIIFSDYKENAQKSKTENYLKVPKYL